ncbi:hypothetical protein [uncultured Ruminococcus sp.]|uniref:hypothetical protein n=1 Tax=uncultured Ruminococcus sp. TaxID=165186 RepID=UPI0029309EAF|nr:hypothetical protein [uncultured Ruminococcus sp.]
MHIYRIAEMNIAVKAQYEETYRYLAEFLTDSESYELLIEPTNEMIRYEAELGKEIHGDPGSPYICESVAILRVICDYIIDKGGFFLHCSCLKYKEDAIIFTAPSGTGKSTHAALWRRHFGDEVTMINDDKPLVREKDGRFVIYGTPWNGKHGIGTNTSAPVKAVVFLSQAPENTAKPISPVEAITLLLQQTVLPSDKTHLSKLLDMLGRMVETIPMLRLGCTISDEAVTTVYREIYGQE